MNKIISEDIQFIINSKIDWKIFKNKTFLISGATGMLLPYMVYSLLNLNRTNSFNTKIILLIRDSEKTTKIFSDYIDDKCLRLLENDITKPIEIEENIDYIIHGASKASPIFFNNNPTDIITSNVLGTYNLLEFAKIKKVKSFLFFSSGAVYGTPISKEAVTENEFGYIDILDIKNCYAESKRIGENMCKCWNKQYNIPVKIVRPTHIYGPTMDIKNDSRVFANFVNCIINNKDIVLSSDGSGKRSFCYIADATVAFFKVLLNGIDCQAYNIGNDSAYISILELAKKFVVLTKENGLKVIVNNDNNEPQDKMLMVSKKVEGLGWKCKFSLNKGIKRTIESFL